MIHGPYWLSPHCIRAHSLCTPGPFIMTHSASQSTAASSLLPVSAALRAHSPDLVGHITKSCSTSTSSASFTPPAQYEYLVDGPTCTRLQSTSTVAGEMKQGVCVSDRPYRDLGRHQGRPCHAKGSANKCCKVPLLPKAKGVYSMAYAERPRPCVAGQRTTTARHCTELLWHMEPWLVARACPLFLCSAALTLRGPL